MKKNKIVVVFSSHLSDEENIKFKEHISNTIGVKHEIVCYVNHNEYSLSELYNKALLKYKDDNVIIVFCHNDIIIKTKNWGRILLSKFNNSNYSIIGVAGSTYLHDNGVWWHDKTKMKGIVEHTDGYNNWMSEYSDERKGQIMPTILIDGLFMTIDPNIIEHKFDEDFKGFHFYDISFCFPNYLDGCDIGVTTDIRILHKSVGQTNKQWEKNSKLFVEKYKDELPKKHVSDDKLKVLICCQFFKNFTGSEVSNYELSKELVKLGCDVTLISTVVGNPLLSKAKKAGVKVYNISNSPNYKIGNNQKLNFYKNEKDFDILHINHKPIGEMILKMYPNTPAVMHIRSEVIPKFEEPIIHPMIKKYISIRDSITEYIKSFNINEDKITYIDNPFDFNRFNCNYNINIKNEKRIVLFIGTLDYLRKEILFDLKKITKENNQILWIIGENNDNYLDELNDEHIIYHGIKPNVEDYIKKCDYTAGIFKGRTTIEGFLCGKGGWIYVVNKQGKILSKEFQTPPKDTEKYSSKYSSRKVFILYNNIINYYK